MSGGVVSIPCGVVAWQAAGGLLLVRNLLPPLLLSPAGPPQPQLPPTVPVDREKTCPLLLRVFPKLGAHNRCGAARHRLQLIRIADEHAQSQS